MQRLSGTVAVVEVAVVVAVVGVVARGEGAAVVAMVARNTLVSAVCFADLRYHIIPFGMPILTGADDYLIEPLWQKQHLQSIEILAIPILALRVSRAHVSPGNFSG